MQVCVQTVQTVSSLRRMIVSPCFVRILVAWCALGRLRACTALPQTRLYWCVVPTRQSNRTVEACLDGFLAPESLQGDNQVITSRRSTSTTQTLMARGRGSISRQAKYGKRAVFVLLHAVGSDERTMYAWHECMRDEHMRVPLCMGVAKYNVVMAARNAVWLGLAAVFTVLYSPSTFLSTIQQRCSKALHFLT